MQLTDDAAARPGGGDSSGTAASWRASATRPRRWKTCSCASSRKARPTPAGATCPASSVPARRNRSRPATAAHRRVSRNACEERGTDAIVQSVERSRRRYGLPKSVLSRAVTSLIHGPRTHMFAALSLEREPLQLQDVPALVVSWFQDWGGFAAFALVIWAHRLCHPPPAAGQPREVSSLGRRCSSWSRPAVAAVVVPQPRPSSSSPEILVRPGQRLRRPAADRAGRRPSPGATPLLLTIGGAAALLAVTLPLLVDLLQIAPELAAHLGAGPAQLQGSRSPQGALGLLGPAAGLPVRQLVPALRRAQAGRPGPQSTSPSSTGP